MAQNDNQSAQPQLPPIDDHKSASEQFFRIITSAKKLSKGVNVGKTASDTFYYGSNSIKTNLIPRIIAMVRKDTHLTTKTRRYYTIYQPEIFASIDPAGIVRFRDANDKSLRMPDTILNTFGRYKSRPYYEMAINVSNQYKEYATKHGSSKEMRYLIYPSQLLFDLRNDGYVTLHATCSKYDVKENVLSGEISLLETVLKRKPDEIEFELKQHELFDENEINKKAQYLQDHTHSNIETLNFISEVNMINVDQCKPGQIYFNVDLTFNNSVFIYYFTLFKEDRSNRMALKWLMERGYFGYEVQAQLLAQFGDEEPTDTSLCY